MTSDPQKRDDAHDDDSNEPINDLFAQLFGANGLDPKLFSQMGQLSPEELAKAAQAGSDPAAMAAMMSQVQAMFSAMTSGSAQAGGTGGAMNWKLARDHARQVAASESDPSMSAEDQHKADEALRLADMWLNDGTSMPSPNLIGQALSRAEWVEKSMDAFIQMTEPVANSVSQALNQVFTEQLPEQMKGMLAQAGSMLQNLGGTMFGVQLGQAVGKLSQEVVSSTDIGVPLIPHTSALLPTNIRAFADGLDIDLDEVRIFLALREAAHARLFAQVPWLASHLLTSIEKFAAGIHIDMSRIEEAARDIDPGNPSSFENALGNGVFAPQTTPEQQAALLRIETLLALIEGWVDTVTSAASANLPHAAALRETLRRRRATGGPGERAFGGLVGLQLRPKRLREAAALFEHVAGERGLEAMDAIWAHPDIMPTDQDLDDPQGFLQRQELAQRSSSKMDEELARLLDEGNAEDES